MMKLSELKNGSHIHLMGICGTAMASLAGLLKDRGYVVTGSDNNPYPPMSTQIESLGIPLMKGYKKENIHNPKPDFVIIGNVISASNEEAQEVMAQKIPYTSLPQAMGECIIENRESIVIAGTHGKTTTTSLMSWVLDQAGLKPGFLIGGIPSNFSQSFRNPAGSIFVIEGDEYDTAYFDKVPKFIHYRPRQVVLTSVEFDHADIYKDFAAVKSAFERLMGLIPSEGHLVYYADDANVVEIAQKTKAKKLSYGIYKEGSIADYQAQILAVDKSGTHFQVFFQGQNRGHFKTPMSGEYNVLNSLAAIIMGEIYKVPAPKVADALLSFAGVKRRQEVRGEPNGILVIEDFAHHPTAVKETIKGIKARYSGRKIFAVFEPRSATSRRKVFQKDYVKAFLNADEVLLAQAFDQSKIDDSERFSSEELVADLHNEKKSANSYAKVEDIVSDLKKKTKSGDLVLVMSNGGFDDIYTKLLKSLAEK